MPTKPTPRVKAWSYSRLNHYKECPRKLKYMVVDKLKTPDKPAQARGTVIHKMAENYALGKLRFVPEELETFKEEFKELRKLVKAGDATVEGELAFRADWSPTGWFEPDAWARVKVDAQILYPKKQHARIIDYKTGQIYEDAKDQLSLYALAEFKQNDDLKTVSAELWYLDQGELVPLEFERGQLLGLQQEWEKRAKPMLLDTHFATRSGDHCRRCPFSKKAGGPCQY